MSAENEIKKHNPQSLLTYFLAAIALITPVSNYLLGQRKADIEQVRNLRDEIKSLKQEIRVIKASESECEAKIFLMRDELITMRGKCESRQ